MNRDTTMRRIGRRMGRSLVLTGLLLAAACTPTTYNPLRDRPDYVDRVLEDVTAMVEGMARAHSADRVRLRDPNYRSLHQPAAQ